MMTLDQIRQELANIARALDLRDAETRAEQNRKWIHIMISSPDFCGKSAGERDNLIWKEFEERFDDETILAITQCYLLTPEERSASVGI